MNNLNLLNSSSKFIIYSGRESNVKIYNTSLKAHQEIPDTTSSITARIVDNRAFLLKRFDVPELYDLTNRKLTPLINDKSGGVFVSYKDMIAYTLDRCNDIAIYNTATNTTQKLSNAFPCTSVPTGITLSSNSIAVAYRISGGECCLRVYDFLGTEKGQINIGSYPQAVAANDQYIAILFCDNRIKFYDANTLEEAAEIKKEDLSSDVHYDIEKKKIAFHQDKFYVFLYNSVRVFLLNSNPNESNFLPLAGTLQSQEPFESHFPPLFVIQDKYLAVAFMTGHSSCCVDLFENGENRLHSFPVKGGVVDMDFNIKEMQLVVASAGDAAGFSMELWNPVISFREEILAAKKADKEELARARAAADSSGKAEDEC